MAPKIFICYSHQDEAHLKRLTVALKPFARTDRINAWSDARLEQGDDWHAEIDRAIDESEVGILLISSDFLASDFITEEEVPRLLARQDAGILKIVPVFLRPCAVEHADYQFQAISGETKTARLTQFQGVATPQKPLSDLRRSDRERAWASLATLIALDPNVSRRRPRRTERAPDTATRRDRLAKGFETTPAAPTARRKVFLAYAREDIAVVREVYAALKKAGFGPWMDKEDIRPGQRWQSEIRRTLHSARLCLVFLSERSAGKQGYVQKEFKLALRLLDEMPEDQIFVIPVRLDPCALPEQFGDIHAADLFEPDGMARLLAAVGYAVGPAEVDRESVDRTLSRDDGVTSAPEGSAATVLFDETPTWPYLPTLARPDTQLDVKFDVVMIGQDGEIVDRWAGAGRVSVEDLGGGAALEMMAMPGGTFTMGSAETEAGRFPPEGPQHEVTIAPHWMGRYAVTQTQWRAVASLPRVNRGLERDPSFFKGPERPVEMVSWEDAVEFCRRLSRRTGRPYRLPTEAEWEYAARAGATTPFHFGPTITPDLVNYDGTCPYGDAKAGAFREETTEVGSFGIANAFGLYDMHGNVWEWVQDTWHASYEGAPTNGRVWEPGGDPECRVLRGGSWNDFACDCRSAFRIVNPTVAWNNSVGFRVVRPVARTP